MGAPEACPHCGAVPGSQSPLEALYQEVARIREIAERQSAEETIASLTREVQVLRETVARLRGTNYRAGVARTQPARSSAA